MGALTQGGLGDSMREHLLLPQPTGSPLAHGIKVPEARGGVGIDCGLLSRERCVAEMGKGFGGAHALHKRGGVEAYVRASRTHPCKVVAVEEKLVSSYPLSSQRHPRTHGLQEYTC